MSTKTTQLTIRDRLESPMFRDEIAKVLPRHLKPERMTRVAITSIMRTPKLAQCDQASFFNAMLQLSQLGLEPDGRKAHLIPFENRKRGVTECQLIVDYKGLVELAMRSGKVSSIHADKVCENDEFTYDAGELISHRIDFSRPRGKAYAYYCRVKFYRGDPKTEVMTRDEVEAIRKRSRAGNSGPWVTDFDEMAKKTVFRRLSKWLELSPEHAEVIDAAERDEFVRQQAEAKRIVARATQDADSVAALLEAPRSEPVEVESPAGYFDRLSDASTEDEIAAISEEVDRDERLSDEDREGLRSLAEARFADVAG